VHADIAVKPAIHTTPLALLAALSLACAGDSPPASDDDSSGGTEPTTGAPATDATDTTAPADDDSGSGDDGTTGEPDDEDDAIRITHEFGPLSLPAFEDNVDRCVSWTLENEKPVYVNAVQMANLGAFHHSNWFVVSDDRFAGEDGYWNCADRGFSEVNASSQGATVLFAQSTQSYTEEQQLAAGAVVKIPARYRVIATLHTLNASPEITDTNLWLTLYPIHPKEVKGVVTGLSIQYKDLDIPAFTEAHYTAKCELDTAYWLATQDPLALRLHYILPHYHYLGNFFEVRVIGGLHDGEVVYSLDGFDGQANGKTFDPPLDLPGATGLSVSCGYDNWRSENVTWGNGEGEMCVMLALVETEALIGASVEFGSNLVGMDGDVHLYEGLCLGIALPESEEQGMPTAEELAAPLYLPPVDPDDQGIPPIPECRDADAQVVPSGEATLTRVRENVFATSCTYSSCHGMSAAAGLDLSGSDVYDELMDHDVLAATASPLVQPGDPEGSHLYQRLAACKPTDDAGNELQHMPYNAPFLLDDGRVALVREWIANGAQDD
jgi:hypothetical protein